MCRNLNSIQSTLPSYGFSSMQSFSCNHFWSFEITRKLAAVAMIGRTSLHADDGVDLLCLYPCACLYHILILVTILHQRRCDDQCTKHGVRESLLALCVKKSAWICIFNRSAWMFPMNRSAWIFTMNESEWICITSKSASACIVSVQQTAHQYC